VHERSTAPTTVAIVVAALLATACGYVSGGRWDNDPGNWGRAFGTQKPPGLVVLHSRYWRSAHWSREFGYFFEVRADRAFRAELFEKNDLVRVPPPDVAGAKSDYFGDLPTWFCPEPAERYDAWRLRSIPTRHFRVLIDKDTGDIFLADYQA